MEISYWQSRWQKQKTGWHMQQVFPLLQKFWGTLHLSQDSVVLVPLCGSSLDLEWLASRGHYIIGVDVSKIAIETLINNHDGVFKKSSRGNLVKYTSDSMELWHGDFLKLQQQWLPSIDAIYDKAALIALPPKKRTTYTAHLQTLTQPNTQILMNTFEYEQDEMPGPPFAVFENELQNNFNDTFSINCLHSHSLFNELINFQRRGLHSYLIEKIYHLQPN